jgi:phage-related protein
MSLEFIIRQTTGKDLSICSFCNKKSSYLCSCCYNTSYCNETCQSKHWDKHSNFIGLTIEGVEIPNDIITLLSKWLDVKDLKNLNLVDKSMNAAIRRILFEKSIFNMNSINNALVDFILTDVRTVQLKNIINEEEDEWKFMIKLRGKINKILKILSMCKAVRVWRQNHITLLKKWKNNLDNLNHIMFDAGFDERVDMSSGDMPKNLTHLTFGRFFNQDVRNRLPPNLTHLTFDWNFDQDIRNGLPTTLTHLTFGDDFNQDVRNGLPDNLTHLTFAYSFNQDIRNGLPDTLTHLKFGNRFNQDVRNGLPPNLTHLTFDWEFNQDVRNGLPSTLTHLIFGYNFRQDIRDGLPPNLKYLRVADDYPRNLRDGLPSFTKFGYWD